MPPNSTESQSHIIQFEQVSDYHLDSKLLKPCMAYLIGKSLCTYLPTLADLAGWFICCHRGRLLPRWQRFNERRAHDTQMPSRVKVNLLDDGVVDTLASVGATSGVHDSVSINVSESARILARAASRRPPGGERPAYLPS